MLFSFKIESKSKKNYDDALDMYADDFGEKEKERLESKEESKASTSGTSLDVAGSSKHPLKIALNREEFHPMAILNWGDFQFQANS